MLNMLALSVALAGGPEDSKTPVVAVEATEDREISDDLSAVNDLAAKARSQAAFARGLAERAGEDIAALKRAQEAGDEADLEFQDTITTLQAELARLEKSKGSAAKVAVIEEQIKSLRYWQEKTDVTFDLLRNRIYEIEARLDKIAPFEPYFPQLPVILEHRIYAVTGVNAGVTCGVPIPSVTGMCTPDVGVQVGLGFEDGEKGWMLLPEARFNLAKGIGTDLTLVGYKLKRREDGSVRDLVLGGYFGGSFDQYGVLDKVPGAKGWEAGAKLGIYAKLKLFESGDASHYVHIMAGVKAGRVGAIYGDANLLNAHLRIGFHRETSLKREPSE